jgi:cobalt-zinc-cadmium efflux system protein
MSRVAGILDVHDLHVWNISTGIPVLTAHVHIGEDADPTAVLSALEVYVRRIGIRHSTIQICNPVAGESGSGSGSGASSSAGGGHAHDHGDEEEGHGHDHGHDHDHAPGACSGHGHKH